MTPRQTRLTVILSILATTIVLDQATKKMAMETLRYRPAMSFLGNTFRLEYSENPGAFLSLGSGLPDSVRFWLLSVGVAIALLGLFIYVAFYSDTKIKHALGMVLLISGGLSNLLDRMFRQSGRVVDFLNLGIGDLRTGIFNVADMLIMVGVGLTILWGNQNPEKPRAKAP